MSATDESGGREEMLYHRSTSVDRSFLFRASNDLMTSVLSYLDVQSICQVDISVSNTAERLIWLTGLSMSNLVTFS